MGTKLYLTSGHHLMKPSWVLGEEAELVCVSFLVGFICVCGYIVLPV